MNFDMAILDLIQSNIRTGFMDAIMPFITQLGDAGLIWIILSIGLIIPKKTRKIGFVMIIALILNGIICNIILKPMLARIRPFDVNTAIKLLISLGILVFHLAIHQHHLRLQASYFSERASYLYQVWYWPF